MYVLFLDDFIPPFQFSSLSYGLKITVQCSWRLSYSTQASTSSFNLQTHQFNSENSQAVSLLPPGPSALIFFWYLLLEMSHSLLPFLLCCIHLSVPHTLEHNWLIHVRFNAYFPIWKLSIIIFFLSRHFDWFFILYSSPLEYLCCWLLVFNPDILIQWHFAWSCLFTCEDSVLIALLIWCVVLSVLFVLLLFTLLEPSLVELL